MALRQCGDYERATDEFETSYQLFRKIKNIRDETCFRRYRYFTDPDETSAMFLWYSLTCQQKGDPDGAIGYLLNGMNHLPDEKFGKLHSLDVLTHHEDVNAMRMRIQERRRQQQAWQAKAQSKSISKGKKSRPPSQPSRQEILCPEEDVETLRIKLWESDVREPILRRFEKDYGKKLTEIPRHLEVDTLLPRYLYFLWLWTQGDGNTQLNELEQVARQLKDAQHPVVKQDVARYDPERPSNMGQSVYVFFETGIAPKWREWHELVNTRPLNSDIQHQITFPHLCLDRSFVPRLNVVAQQASVGTEIIWDMERIVAQQFSVKFPAIAQKAVNSTINNTISYILSEDSFRQSLAKIKDPNVRARMIQNHEAQKQAKLERVRASCKQANRVSDWDTPPAYFYGYRLLQPSNIQVARIDMPPDRKLTLSFPNGKWEKEITVIHGNVTVVWVKSANDKQPEPCVSQFRLN